MLHYVDSKKMGRGSHGWLESHHHFSFANYYNPQNMNFGVLRVVNDDIVQVGRGFDTHGHQDMEIISYVLEGELTHADSMGNRHTLTRGQVQYMSAGTGVTHSEHNLAGSPLRFLQIWIQPDQKGHLPNYGDHLFAMEERQDRWLPLVAGNGNPQSAAPIHIHADANLSAAVVSTGNNLELAVDSGRQAYLIVGEGSAEIGGIRLKTRDALEIVEEAVVIHAVETAHIVVIEMAKG